MLREFQDLHHITGTVVEITSKFREWDLLVLQYNVDEEIMKKRYHDMLREDIREFVSVSGYKTLNDMVNKAHE